MILTSKNTICIRFSGVRIIINPLLKIQSHFLNFLFSVDYIMFLFSVVILYIMLKYNNCVAR